jgi:hypothetical protein
MNIKIRPYLERDTPVVVDFNRRLRAAGETSRFPESHIPFWLPEIEGRKIYQQYFLALENGLARGAYILKHQDFSFWGAIISIGDYQLPLSEGLIDHAYNVVGIAMLADALRKQPCLYGLGMGGVEAAIAKMFKAMGWTLHTVPFYFKVTKPIRFLRNINYLRNNRMNRFLLDLLAYSGVGPLAFKALQTRGTKRRLPAGVSAEIVNGFSAWADHLWEDCKDKYAMVAVRDSHTMNILYPPGNDRFIILKVMQGSHSVGWAVAIDTLMTGHKHFGGMRVGSIIDCLAIPENAAPVISSAAEYLESRGVDLILSNQSHVAWGLALKKAGFFRGPSNFVLAASKSLCQLLQPFDDQKLLIHMNRGDGGGPIHL